MLIEILISHNINHTFIKKLGSAELSLIEKFLHGTVEILKMARFQRRLKIRLKALTRYLI